MDSFMHVFLHGRVAIIMLWMVAKLKITNIKSLRLEKSLPQKEADHFKNHAFVL